MLTPDEDIYLVALDQDVDDWVALGPRGGVPRRCARSRLIYRFPHTYSVNEMDAIMREAHTVVVAEDATAGAAASGAASGATAGATASGATAGASPAGSVGNWSSIIRCIMLRW